MTAKEKTHDHIWLSRARKVIAVEIAGLERIQKALDKAFVRALQLLAHCQGRVVVTGIGKSGLVGRKIAATLSSTGTPAFFLHPVEGAHGDLGMLRSDDIALALSNSGETDELNAIIPVLKASGIQVIAMTGKKKSRLGLLADIVLDCGVPEEACPFDLAPTASTTATLAMGDALAVCLIHWKGFDKEDFKQRHPGGSLGQRLRLPISQLMHTTDLPVARQDSSYHEAVELLDRGGLGALALVDEAGHLTGILTDGDVRRILVQKLCKDDTAPVSQHMTTHPGVARLSSPAAEVLDIMEKAGITVVPVVDRDFFLKGMVHLHDLLGKGELTFAPQQADAAQ